MGPNELEDFVGNLVLVVDLDGMGGGAGGLRAGNVLEAKLLFQSLPKLKSDSGNTLMCMLENSVDPSSCVGKSLLNLSALLTVVFKLELTSSSSNVTHPFGFVLSNTDVLFSKLNVSIGGSFEAGGIVEIRSLSDMATSIDGSVATLRSWVLNGFPEHTDPAKGFAQPTSKFVSPTNGF